MVENKGCDNSDESLVDDTEVPMAAAFPAPPTPTEKSDITMTTQPPPEPTPVSTTEYQGTEPTNDVEGAIYWKNPTPAMLEHANADMVGGILFIATTIPRGKFTLAKNIRVGHILSGSILDLSIADFVHPVTTIAVGSILGGMKVIVPRGVRVETKGLGILAGFTGVNSQTVNAGQDAPIVIVQGLAILASVAVEVNLDVPPVRIVP